MRQGLTTYYGTVNGGGRTEEEDAMRSGDRCGLGVQASKGQLERACPLCHVTVRYGRWGVTRVEKVSRGCFGFCARSQL